ncbi:hypothetical protein GGU11DRAFT_669611, partial [Lentinula aff. detonsa]
AFLMNVITTVALIYASPYYWKQEYHNSAFTGHAWIQELIHGHPDHIRSELGVRLPVFVALVEQLRVLGMEDTRYITIEEQVAIFLY